MTVLAHPLNAIQATPYPADLLPEGGTGLCLFAAAFLGANDAIHMARKDMVVKCVDIDRKRLEEMRALYPSNWEWAFLDAWKHSEAALRLGDTWDVVSVDTFLGNATSRSLQTLELWCELADLMVTATIPVRQTCVVPEGWRAQIFPRSHRASWLVLQRD